MAAWTSGDSRGSGGPVPPGWWFSAVLYSLMASTCWRSRHDVRADYCCKIASLTMSAVSSTFAHTTACTRRRAPFRSRWKGADPTKARSQSSFRSGTQSDPCISSVHNSIMITTSNSSFI